MAGNQGRHARQRAAKEARRRAVVAIKRKADVAVSSSSLSHRVSAAASAPVWRCLINAALFEVGIGNVFFARQLPSGMVAGAFFLVDVHCLGVKDAFYREGDATKFEESLRSLGEMEDLRDADPALARKLVNEAAAYAADLGLPSSADFRVVEALFGDVDATACTDTFDFGKDGKPLFVAGPKDSPARIRQVVGTLERRLGPDGFHCIVPLG